MSVPALLATAPEAADRHVERAFEGLLARVRAAAPSVDVQLSYVNDSHQSVSDALTRFANRGQSVVVVPLSLTATMDTKGSIPAVIRATRKKTPSISITYARALGPHPLLLQAIQRRIDLAKVPRSAALVVAAAGWTDPDANAEIAKVARLLWEWRGSDAPVEAGYTSLTTPRVNEVVDRFQRLGHNHIAVVSYFLTPDHLYEVAKSAAQPLAVTTPFGDSDEVASLVLERYVEAAGFSPPSSCDTCVYRVSWPGHEHLVGAPQRIPPTLTAQ